MQATPNLPALPMDAPDARSADPAHIVALLTGSSHIVLGGFRDSTAQTGSWAHPAAAFVPAGDFEKSESKIAARRRFWSRFVVAASLVVASVLAFVAGVIVATSGVDWGQRANAASLGWHIQSVTPSGVVVRMGGLETNIAVGGRLPSGELIVSVQPERRAVFLERSTIIVRQGVDREERKNEQ